MASKHIFMTGASGYIGSVIVEFAIAFGYSVTGLSRSPASDAKLEGLGATPVRGDLKTHDVLTRESAKADIVMHLADAICDDFHMDYREVVRIDGAVIDAIAKGLEGSNKRLIVTSGSLVSAADPSGKETTESSPLWEKPLNDRISSEKHALAQSAKGIRVTAIRLAPWVYGRGGSGVKIFMGMAATTGKISYIGDGSNFISTVHVDDAARLYLLAAIADEGSIYNATAETDVTMAQLMTAMGKTLNVPVLSMPFDDAVAKMGGFLAGFLRAENRASSVKARTELNWAPREVGILEEVEKGSYVEFAKTLRGSDA